MPDQFLEQLVNTIAPTGGAIINFPTKIWVFGGAIAPTTQDPSKSLRDSFWRKQLNSFPPDDRVWFVDLDRPENHQGWWAFSGYDNLLEFERDACYLARQVILFSESPGAFAELGALAADNFLLPSIQVVVQQKYLDEADRESFLNLGPIKRIELQGNRCVIGGDDATELADDDYQVILESVESSASHARQARVELNLANPMHRLLLIADLVDLLLVSKISDLIVALAHFSMRIEEVELRKALMLLSFFGFVGHETRGVEPFWVRKVDSLAPWVDYKTSIPQIPFDRSRFKTQHQSLLEQDKRRNNIFQRVAA